jgi:hypothetical protein
MKPPYNFPSPSKPLTKSPTLIDLTTYREVVSVIQTKPSFPPEYNILLTYLKAETKPPLWTGRVLSNSLVFQT